MGEIKLVISDEVEYKFRVKAMKRFRYTKGALSLAGERALAEWSESDSKIDEMVAEMVEEIKDPVAVVRGMLKHVKKSSVELQHEIGKIRGG